MQLGGDVLQRDISKSDQEKACLSEKEIIELAAVGVALEKIYGNPRDIEWAFYENNVYLLQSRPITTLNALSNWELLHEMDTPVMSPDDLFTFANVGEVFPDAVTPLTYSTVVYMLQRTTSRNITGHPPEDLGLFDSAFAFSSNRVVFELYKVSNFLS